MTLLLFVSIQTNLIHADNISILKNADFEIIDNCLPTNWVSNLPKGKQASEALAVINIEKNKSYDGSNCILINNIKPSNTKIQQLIWLDSNKLFKLALFAKAEDIPSIQGGMSITIENNLLYYTTNEIFNTGNNWVKYEFYFRTSNTDDKNYQFIISLGNQNALNTGKIYLDNISIEPFMKVGKNTKVSEFIPYSNINKNSSNDSVGVFRNENLNDNLVQAFTNRNLLLIIGFIVCIIVSIVEYRKFKLANIANLNKKDDIY